MLVAHNVELLRRLSLFTNCRSAHKLARILIVPRSLEKVTAKHKHTPFRLAPAHTPLPVNVTAALNPSQLTDPHLHFTLTKFAVTVSSLLALHFKKRHRQASVIYLRKETQTRAHTSPRSQHSRPDHIPPARPAPAIHTGSQEIWKTSKPCLEFKASSTII